MLSKLSSKQGEDSLDFFPFKSLYGVLDSMQGLREVIQGISLDEIIEADEKAKRLIQRLSSLQTNLAGLDATRKFLAGIKVTVSRESASYPLPQTTVPNLDAIKKLLIKLKEPSAVEKKISLPQDLANLDATKQFLARVKEIIAKARAEDRTEPKKDLPKRHAATQGTKAPNNLIPFPGPSRIAKEESKSSQTPLEEALLLAENQLAVESRIQKTRPDKLTERTEALESRSNDFTLGAKSFAEDKFEQEFSLTDPREQTAVPPETLDAGHPSANMESTSSKGDGQSATRDGSFDQDLLTKLIKDYGEFTIYTKLSAELETPASPLNPLDTAAMSSQPGTPKTNLLRTHSWQHKEGDLDRKLKKLMNDYGNVDKYSINRNDKLKRVAALIGVLVLIAVISASFFIYRPTTPSVQQSNTDALPAAPAQSPSSSVSQTRTTNVQPTKTKFKSSTPTGEKESPAAKEE